MNTWPSSLSSNNTSVEAGAIPSVSNEETSEITCTLSGHQRAID